MYENKTGGEGKDHLVKHGFAVLALFHVGSVANLAFQFLAGRTLSRAGYGTLYSMLGFLLVFMVPMRALQTTISHFTGHLYKENRRGDVLLLARMWENKLLITGTPLLVLAFILSIPLANYFHLTTAWPLVLVFCSAFIFSFLQLYVGALQGAQSFFWMCITSNGWSVIRLGAGLIMLLLVSATALNGLSAHLIGTVSITIIACLILRRMFKNQPASGQALDATDRYFMLSMLALLAYSVLMNGDVVLVKIFFSAEADYGDYARASAIGRMIVFLVQPLAMALFPKVVAKGVATPAHKKTLLRALLMAGGMIAIAVALCAVFPHIPLNIIFGDIASDSRSANLLRIIAAAMAPLGLAFMIVNYELAQHRFRFLFPLSACAVLFVLGIALFHASIWQVAGILCCAGYACLGLLLLDLIVFQPNGRKPPDTGS